MQTKTGQLKREPLFRPSFFIKDSSFVYYNLYPLLIVNFLTTTIYCIINSVNVNIYEKKRT